MQWIRNVINADKTSNVEYSIFIISFPTSPGSSSPASTSKEIHGLQTRTSSSLGAKCQCTMLLPTLRISSCDTRGCCEW